MAKRTTSRTWSEVDTERLRQHIMQGGSVHRAAVIFKRSPQALRHQAFALGLKFPTIRELRKRANGSEYPNAPSP
jgi:hypothetical protein